MKRGELVEALLFIAVLAGVAVFWYAFHEIDKIARGA